jgi:hypothetical protein
MWFTAAGLGELTLQELGKADSSLMAVRSLYESRL